VLDGRRCIIALATCLPHDLIVVSTSCGGGFDVVGHVDELVALRRGRLVIRSIIRCKLCVVLYMIVSDNLNGCSRLICLVLETAALCDISVIGMYDFPVMVCSAQLRSSWRDREWRAQRQLVHVRTSCQLLVSDRLSAYRSTLPSLPGQRKVVRKTARMQMLVTYE